jgi:hypothetical protein
LNVVEKLIPDPCSRVRCDSGARHHTWSCFDATETLIEEREGEVRGMSLSAPIRL